MIAEPSALARLSGAVHALAEARSLDDIKAIIDIAEAATTYARAAKLGLEAQNHAAEIKIRAERKAGELLAQLDRNGGGDRKSEEYQMSSAGHLIAPSTYAATLADADVTRQDASRWQTIAKMPEPAFEAVIDSAHAERQELTTAAVLRAASGVHVAFSTGNNEWYTPAEYTDAARAVMGGIDLDPASSARANESVGAAAYFDEESDGASAAHTWRGRVWMNPPYSGGQISRFCSKMRAHVEAGDVTAACVLVNNATETAWFLDLVSVAAAVCFPFGRIRFRTSDERVPGTPLQGQAVIYIGDSAADFRREFEPLGWVALL